MTQDAAPTATAKGPYYATVEAAEIFGRRLLTAHGLPDEDAKIVAGCLVRADLRGVDTHGLQYLPHYLDRLRRGLINPKPVLKVEKVTPMIGALDGHDGFGFVVATKAMAAAIDMARPTFAVMGSNIFIAGSQPGQAQMVKLRSPRCTSTGRGWRCADDSAGQP